MKALHFKFSDQTASFETYLDFYLKKKSTDCILYSDDGSKFRVHKELFGQTDFLREILSSTKEHCCFTIEVICPCSKVELKHLVNFLYDGEIHCKKESDSLKGWNSILPRLSDCLHFRPCPHYQNHSTKKLSPFH